METLGPILITIIVIAAGVALGWYVWTKRDPITRWLLKKGWLKKDADDDTDYSTDTFNKYMSRYRTKK